jgi:hypothetical protein
MPRGSLKVAFRVAAECHFFLIGQQYA